MGVLHTQRLCALLLVGLRDTRSFFYVVQCYSNQWVIEPFRLIAKLRCIREHVLTAQNCAELKFTGGLFKGSAALRYFRVRFGNTSIKIGTIQRRLAWPLRKDDTQNREAFHIF